jgi:hypothetical protein
MSLRSILILSVVAVGPFWIEPSAAQGLAKPGFYTPSYSSFCSAQGSPPCSISCPAGRTAVCNNGGLISGQCLCR